MSKLKHMSKDVWRNIHSMWDLTRTSTAYANLKHTSMVLTGHKQIRDPSGMMCKGPNHVRVRSARCCAQTGDKESSGQPVAVVKNLEVWTRHSLDSWNQNWHNRWRRRSPRCQNREFSSPTWGGFSAALSNWSNSYEAGCHLTISRKVGAEVSGMRQW